MSLGVCCLRILKASCFSQICRFPDWAICLHSFGEQGMFLHDVRLCVPQAAATLSAEAKAKAAEAEAAVARAAELRSKVAEAAASEAAAAEASTAARDRVSAAEQGLAVARQRRLAADEAEAAGPGGETPGVALSGEASVELPVVQPSRGLSAAERHACRPENPDRSMALPSPAWSPSKLGSAQELGPRDAPNRPTDLPGAAHSPAAPGAAPGRDSEQTPDRPVTPMDPSASPAKPGPTPEQAPHRSGGAQGHVARVLLLPRAGAARMPDAVDGSLHGGMARPLIVDDEVTPPPLPPPTGEKRAGAMEVPGTLDQTPAAAGRANGDVSPPPLPPPSRERRAGGSHERLVGYGAQGPPGGDELGTHAALAHPPDSPGGLSAPASAFANGGHADLLANGARLGAGASLQAAPSAVSDREVCCPVCNDPLCMCLNGVMKTGDCTRRLLQCVQCYNSTSDFAQDATTLSLAA